MNTIIKTPKTNNSEESILQNNVIFNKLFRKQVSEYIDFYISGSIESAENYIEIFNSIRNLSSVDFIKIHINSYGGNLYTAIQFMRVLRETEATIICSVEGACFSAATIIFLCGDLFEISPHSSFMFHNYSGLVAGKGGEMISQIQYEKKWSEKLLRDVYVDFLTEKEIQDILENKDIWMDSEEVVKRLEKRKKSKK